MKKYMLIGSLQVIFFMGLYGAADSTASPGIKELPVPADSIAPSVQRIFDLMKNNADAGYIQKNDEHLFRIIRRFSSQGEKDSVKVTDFSSRVKSPCKSLQNKKMIYSAACYLLGIGGASKDEYEAARRALYVFNSKSTPVFSEDRLKAFLILDECMSGDSHSHMYLSHCGDCFTGVLELFEHSTKKTPDYKMKMKSEVLYRLARSYFKANLMCQAKLLVGIIPDDGLSESLSKDVSDLRLLINLKQSNYMYSMPRRRRDIAGITIEESSQKPSATASVPSPQKSAAVTESPRDTLPAEPMISPDEPALIKIPQIVPHLASYAAASQQMPAARPCNLRPSKAYRGPDAENNLQRLREFLKEEEKTMHSSGPAESKQ